MEYANREPPEPSNPAGWYELYRKLLTESEEQEAAMEEQLRAAMAGVKNGVAKNQLQCDSGPKPIPIPKLGGMIFCHEPKPKKPTAPVTTETLRFGSGSRTKTWTGHGLMNKVRKQTRESALFRPGGRGNLSTPSHLLHASKVTAIPKSMRPLPQRRIPAPQRVLPPNGSAPMSKAAAAAALRLQSITSKLPAKAPAPSPMSMEERERRLRALTQRQETASDANSRLALSVHAGPPTTAPTSAASIPPRPPPARAPAENHASRLLGPDFRTPKPPVKKRSPADPLMPAKRRRIERSFGHETAIMIAIQRGVSDGF